MRSPRVFEKKRYMNLVICSSLILIHYFLQFLLNQMNWLGAFNLHKNIEFCSIRCTPPLPPF